jgi:hypothetical protein
MGRIRFECSAFWASHTTGDGVAKGRGWLKPTKRSYPDRGSALYHLCHRPGAHNCVGNFGTKR